MLTSGTYRSAVSVTTSESTVVLLLSHGSRDPRAEYVVGELVSAVAAGDRPHRASGSSGLRYADSGARPAAVGGRGPHLGARRAVVVHAGIPPDPRRSV